VRVRIKRRHAVPAAALAAILLSQGLAASATADDWPNAVSFTDPKTATLEYGQYWYFPLSCDADFYNNSYSAGTATATVTGAPSGFTPQFDMYTSFGPGSTCSGGVATGYDTAPLNAGNYSITVRGSYEDGGVTYNAQTPTPAVLTIEKAKIGVELRVVPDSSDAEAVIVTARFTGRFVDEYQSSFFPGAAKSPAGIWKITLVDSAGEVATERSIERAAGDDVLATSFYWADGEPGQTYTASAQFTAESSSASNFAITQAGDFDFTVADSPRPVPSSTAAAEPDSHLPEATGFSLPLWVVVVSTLLIVGLGVLVTLLSLRLRRRSTATTGEKAA
jgi:hypothetical protein